MTLFMCLFLEHLRKEHALIAKKKRHETHVLTILMAYLSSDTFWLQNSYVNEKSKDREQWIKVLSALHMT